MSDLESIYEQILLEKTVKYFIPKDKKKLMYDFYMMMNLNAIVENLSPGRKNINNQLIDTDTIRTGNLNENIKDSFDAAKEKLISYCKKHMLDAVFFAICAEFRHASNQTYNIRDLLMAIEDSDNKLTKEEKTLYKHYYNKFNQLNDGMKLSKTRGVENGDRYVANLNENDSYRNSYEAALYSISKSNSTKVSFMKLCYTIFTQASWNNMYGGKAWGKIVKSWFSLYNSKGELETMVAIDHIYDLQHNTDTVFNKLNSYYDNGYNWIKEALDKRANIKSPYVLYDHISESLKTMSGYILKADGYKSWEDYIKSTSSKDSEESKDTPFKKINNGSKKTSGGLGKMLKDIDLTHMKNTWKDGTWENGTWENGIWEDGTWENGIWEDGTWVNGTWEDGIWEDGLWLNGTWKNGTWEDGIWEDGTWEDGIWEKGTWRDGEWKDGIWKRGTWDKGTWKDGVWLYGIWYKGTWLNGEWNHGEWKDGTWEKGTWEKGTWKKGTWRDGLWVNGIWEDGTWENGTWVNGIWEKGTWVKGEIFDKETKRYVKSDVNPNEYFKNKQKTKNESNKISFKDVFYS